MSIRDKEHFVWRSLLFTVNLLILIISGITSLGKATIVIPFTIFYLFSISNMPEGSMETGYD